MLFEYINENWYISTVKHMLTRVDIVTSKFVKIIGGKYFLQIFFFSLKASIIVKEI